MFLRIGETEFAKKKEISENLSWSSIQFLNLIIYSFLVHLKARYPPR